MTTSLRVDPWDPEYGGSWEVAPEPRPEGDVRLDVEVIPWEPVPGEAPEEALRHAFIDGVRRIDVRLFAEADEAMAPGLAGSWAVGMAVVGRAPSIESVRVGRELVVGGGLDHPDLVSEIGGSRLRYRYRAVDGTAPQDPLYGLQNLMRDQETRLAAEVLERGRADLLVLDGPLTYAAVARTGPLVGLVKRQSRAYLPPERAELLGRLEPGRRTPLFHIGGQRLERYSWYARVGEGRRIDGIMTGIVRLEVAADVG
ncbi:MAG: DNA double-strand break repair nuclease NurA, partial [Acidobacteriota bacterium]